MIKPICDEKGGNSGFFDAQMRTLLEQDRNPARNDILLERSVEDFGSGVIDKRCFIDRGYHEAERERLWPRVWQLACLEQEIPQVGDFQEYVIVDQTILIVRSTPTVIRAYFNACPHRGMRLKSGSGRAQEIRCPFHGWSWRLDGSLRDVPCRWDFPEVKDSTHGLKECRVASWNGFVFINMDPQAPSFEEFLGGTLLRHFQNWPLASRRKLVHVAKVFPCNWKLSLLAFVEAYHVLQTHPEWIPFAGDALTQYDVYGLHSRLIVPLGIPSPHLGVPMSQQGIVDSMGAELFLDPFGGPNSSPVQVALGQDARAAVADFRREFLTKAAGDKFGHCSDSELVDIIQYSLFPNVAIFPGELGQLIYRVRPNGDQHESSLFEMMVLGPVADTDAPAAPVPMRLIRDDESYFDIPELATVARNMSEDASNLEKIQLAQHSHGFAGPTYARYQEMGIRQFHKRLDEWLQRD